MGECAARIFTSYLGEKENYRPLPTPTAYHLGSLGLMGLKENYIPLSVKFDLNDFVLKITGGIHMSSTY